MNIAEVVSGEKTSLSGPANGDPTHGKTKLEDVGKKVLGELTILTHESETCNLKNKKAVSHLPADKGTHTLDTPTDDNTAISNCAEKSGDTHNAIL